jgi:glycosyltransferase involved in cell wall biosynthesis
MNKRVLFVAADLSEGGGVNRVIVDLANLLARTVGYDVTILNGRSSRGSLYELDARVRVANRKSGSTGLLGYAFELVKARRASYDFVLSFWTHDNLIALTCFFGSRSRVFVCEHTSFFHVPGFVSFLRKLFYGLADRICVLNKAEYAYYKCLGRTELMPNPVMYLSCCYRPVKEREKLVIGVGHLIERKGFADLISAFEASGIALAGWRLVILGSGLLRDELEKQRTGGSFPASVSIIPPDTQIANWYLRASVIVIPSRIEVFSMALAEGMSFGLIPIAYATDGPCDILEDFPEQIVTQNDRRALSERLAVAATEQHEDEELRRAVRRSISLRCAPHQVTEKWLRLFAEGA